MQETLGEVLNTEGVMEAVNGRPYTDSAGKQRSAKGKLASDFMRDAGQDVTLAQVNRFLLAHDMSLSGASFDTIYEDLFGETPAGYRKKLRQGRQVEDTHCRREEVAHVRKVEATAAQVADRLLALVAAASDGSPERVDAVASFARFAMAVEAVGGVANARLLLSEVERALRVIGV